MGDPVVSRGGITYNDATHVFSVYANLTFGQAGTETYTVTISHGNSQPTTIIGSATVSPAVSTTTLTSSPSIVYGQTATLTATVSGYETTGTRWPSTPARHSGRFHRQRKCIRGQRCRGSDLERPGTAREPNPYTIIAAYASGQPAEHVDTSP